MKKMKRLAAMLLALIMVLGMSVTVFAEPNVTRLDGAVPSAGDKVDVTIQGLNEDGKDDAVVTLYQIATPNYDQNGQKGFNGFTWVEGITAPITSEPDSQQVNMIAKGIADGTIKATVVSGGTTANGVYTNEVGAGVYIATIKGTGKYIYNPLFLTATYNENGNLEGGNINTATAMYGVDATVKRSEQDVDKNVNVEGSKVVVEDLTIPDNNGYSDNNNKNTASLGSVITYDVTPTIPAYPASAINKTFYLTDRMSKGLTFDFSSLRIKVDGVAIYANDNGEFVLDGVVIAKASEKKEGETTGFNLAFQYEELAEKLAGSDGVIPAGTIVVTYQARVNENAVVGIEGNINKATLIFTRDPNVGQTWKDPDNEPDPDTAEGLDKKEKEEIVYTYQIAFLKTGEGDDETALADAIFGIYSDEECTQLVDVVKTNANGYAVSTQVSAGKYYVKEIQAPTGYSLNTKVYEVEATWATATKTVKQEATEREYTTNPDESLNGVQVGWILDGVFYESEVEGSQAAYVKSETQTTSSVTTIDKNENTSGAGTVLVGETIPNTKMSSLPSTGGIGTTIFTIGGCLIMIVAAGLFFASRKKSAK